ncbi:MAG TPA: hypothetical protein VHU22_23995 [Xanthobacteraceae bacterium]|nr:hypothetical protein [Xanthobacteraceae bacterium]
MAPIDGSAMMLAQAAAHCAGVIAFCLLSQSSHPDGIEPGSDTVAAALTVI